MLSRMSEADPVPTTPDPGGVPGGYAGERYTTPPLTPIFMHFCEENGDSYSSLMTFMGSCLFVPSIYLSAESRMWFNTIGPSVTRRPSKEGSERGTPLCGSGGKI